MSGQTFFEHHQNRVKIIADYREDTDILMYFKECGAEVDVRPLPAGDFLTSAQTVVERKTRSDFENSIIDGRIFKQLENMRLNYKNVVVVVEGAKGEERIRKEALLGAYASIIADYNATLFFTQNKFRTAELIFAIAKHEQLAEKRPIRLFARRKPLTLSEQQLALIESIPMIGRKKAEALLEHFGSIKKLSNASVKQLSEVEGIGEKRAKIIFEIFSKKFKQI
ncbi:MAG: ERCC4 domain-containing protein [Candidatus Anstonellales archaeon]